MLITQSKERDNNELDPLGDRDYCKATQDLVFGPESPVIQENLVRRMCHNGGLISRKCMHKSDFYGYIPSSIRTLTVRINP